MTATTASLDAADRRSPARNPAAAGSVGKNR
jgi:hypothetical protein